MRNIADKVVEKNHAFYVKKLFFFGNLAVCEIMWKNIIKPVRTQMTIWRMRTACCIPQTTDTQSECVILIAFPLQQWLHERASMLHNSILPVLL